MNRHEGGAYAGAAIAALGAGVAALMYLQPLAMRAPPAFVYLCALAFVFAGLAVVARARDYRLLEAWLPVLMIGCLVAPAVWLAFGSGRRQCTLSAAQSVVRIVGTRSDLPCRIGFALAAVVGVAILLLVLRQAIRRSRGEGTD